MSFRTFKAPDNEICGSHLGVAAIKFKGEDRPPLIIVYSADVYLVATVTRNCKNALSSPNFQISEGHLQHFKCHLQNLARKFVVVANSQATPL